MRDVREINSLLTYLLTYLRQLVFSLRRVNVPGVEEYADVVIDTSLMPLFAVILIILIILLCMLCVELAAYRR